MRRAQWGVVLTALVTVGLVGGGLALRHKARAVVAQEGKEQGPALEGGHPGPAPSAFWTAYLGSSGKANQLLHIIDEGCAAATIGVEVRGADGQLSSWERVESLEQAGPDDRVFVVEVEDDGTAMVRFGDGKHGAIPPAGEKGFRVRYIAGGGAGGEVVAVETGARRLGRAGQVDWTRETVSEATVELLRQRAAEKRYRVTTLRESPDGGAVVTRYETSGRWLHVMLYDLDEGPGEGQTVLSVGAID